MMVMMTAMTPSLNASSRPLPMEGGTQETLDARPVAPGVLVSQLDQRRRIHGVEQQIAQEVDGGCAVSAEAAYHPADQSGQPRAVAGGELAQVPGRAHHQQADRPQPVRCRGSRRQLSEHAIEALQALDVRLQRVEKDRMQQQSRHLLYRGIGIEPSYGRGLSRIGALGDDQEGGGAEMDGGGERRG